MRVTLLAGMFGDKTAPARLHSPLVGVDVSSAQGGTVALALDPRFEYGVLPLEGRATIAGEGFATDEFAYLGAGIETFDLELAAASRVLLLGGEPFAEQIVMWWNFVGFSQAEIARAQRDWESGDPRFGEIAGYGGQRLAAPALPWAGLA